MYRENPAKIPTVSLHLESLPLQTLRLFFFFSPFQFLLILLFLSLLILLVGDILRLIILLFLYFNCLLYYRHA